MRCSGTEQPALDQGLQQGTASAGVEAQGRQSSNGGAQPLTQGRHYSSRIQNMPEGGQHHDAGTQSSSVENAPRTVGRSMVEGSRQTQGRKQKDGRCGDDELAAANWTLSRALLL